MANVLVATLGENPIVVTAMVKALREFKGIDVETVYILYPCIETERLIGLGYDLIEGHLRGMCQVQPCPLGFSDASGYDESIQFLRRLAKVLDDCERNSDTVHLSLAGGRKNMSALLAVISQFYPCVKGLYHLLDRFEHDEKRRNFYAIEELFEMTEGEREARLSPPVDHLNLVDIPYACFSNAIELRRYFSTEARGEEFSLETSGVAEAFFRAVFQPNRSYQLLDVFLSRTAYEQFEALPGGERLKTFRKCFSFMRDPHALKGHIHGKFSAPGKTLHFFKLRRTRERPFYYTLPDPIHLFPQRSVESVVICGLSVEQPNGSYSPSAEQLLGKADWEPYRKLEALKTDEMILLVPLGESPMIATQAYVLLQERERLQISLIVALYPQEHAPIRNSVDLLDDLCERRGISFEKKPIPSLRDVDSRSACETYLEALLRTIDEFRTKYPRKQITLLLSGGRKGMSALSLFAAQSAGIEQVYHTLITDPKVEQQVERDCTLQNLRSISATKQAERLLLESYDRDKFVLFRVPVIPIR